ncbi:MAG: pilin [Patescibacteria group bacterium]|nr:pilin [Patescibacteria group bacterium]
MRIALSKKIALLAPLFMFSLLAFAPAAALATSHDVIEDPSTTGYGLGGPEDQGFRKVGLGQGNDVKGSIANIINIILGFLGIIAVIIILAGGFKWMTAGGNEDKVAESRQMIIQGVIGLVVVFAAWAIASFVVTNLQTATTT